MLELIKTAIEICGLARTMIYILLVLLFFTSCVLTLSLLAKYYLTSEK